jgi:hypothetical protein
MAHVAASVVLTWTCAGTPRPLSVTRELSARVGGSSPAIINSRIRSRISRSFI